MRVNDNDNLLLSGDVEQNPGPLASKPNRLINRGNVCYANSTIQLLWMIPELVDSFIHTTSTNPFDMALQQLFTTMHNRPNSSTNTFQFH